MAKAKRSIALIPANVMADVLVVAAEVVVLMLVAVVVLVALLIHNRCHCVVIPFR